MLLGDHGVAGSNEVGVLTLGLAVGGVEVHESTAGDDDLGSARLAVGIVAVQVETAIGGAVRRAMWASPPTKSQGADRVVRPYNGTSRTTSPTYGLLPALRGGTHGSRPTGSFRRGRRSPHVHAAVYTLSYARRGVPSATVMTPVYTNPARSRQRRMGRLASWVSARRWGMRPHAQSTASGSTPLLIW